MVMLKRRTVLTEVAWARAQLEGTQTLMLLLCDLHLVTQFPCLLNRHHDWLSSEGYCNDSMRLHMLISVLDIK